MIIYSKSIFFIILLLISKMLYADPGINGFTKVHWLNYRSQNDTKANNEFFQINRISLLNPISDELTFEASYELTQIFTKINSFELKNNYSNGKRPYRVWDIHQNISNNASEYFLNQNLDRFSFTWYGNYYITSVGRQQIAFGSGHTVNPTDIFTPYSYTTIDTEVRNGVDAIRYRHQIGEMGQYDVGVLFGEHADKDDSAVYLRIKNILGKYEVQPIVSIFQEASMLGLDVETTVSGSTVWLEGACVKPKNESSYIRAVIGSERRVDEDVTLFWEFYHNGAGKSNVSDYSKLSNDFSYKKAGVFLLGKNYLNIGSGIQLNSLQTLSFGVKNNLNDNSVFINMDLQWNVSDNAYYDFGLYVPLGKRPHNINDIVSEFGSMPSTFFAEYRYYF